MTVIARNEVTKQSIKPLILPVGGIDCFAALAMTQGAK